MKKIIAMLLAVLMLAACFAGCAKKADTDSAFVKDKGTLIVGITDYAPMDFLDENGNWTGFDAEFAEAFAKKLGVKCEFLLIDWDNKFFELESKNIDCIWNGMTITDEAKLNSSVSAPYAENAQVVVMNADVAGKYTDTVSLMGLSFAVEKGSAGEDCLIELGIDNYVAPNDQATALMEVAAGTSDACVIDLAMANAMTGAGTSYANLTQAMRLNEEVFGVSFRKDSDLTAQFNETLAAMTADGSLQTLADKYGLALCK